VIGKEAFFNAIFTYPCNNDALLKVLETATSTNFQDRPPFPVEEEISNINDEHWPNVEGSDITTFGEVGFPGDEMTFVVSCARAHVS
jgi:hypothetical protein